MRENNNFNEVIYPEGLNDEQREEFAAQGMDHRVGVNEDLVDAEPYNAKNSDLKQTNVELVEEGNNWTRVDNDGYIYSDREEVIATEITGEEKSIKVGETYNPVINVTPFTANLPKLTWYKSSETPANQDQVPVVNILDGVIVGVNPGTCTIVAKVPHVDGVADLASLYAEFTITVV